MTSKTTSIVVIGGSYAGIGVSHELLKQQLPNTKVTLINPTPELYYNIAAPRLITKPNLIPEEKYIYSIPDAFQKYPADAFQFVQGKAVAIDLETKLVSIESPTAEPVMYDYLVIASGSTTPATMGRESFQAPFKALVGGDLRGCIERTHAAIRDAKTIVIGGAGPVGVEFAGELVEAFAGEEKKEVTLISGAEKPLPGLTLSVQDAAAQVLREKGVTLKTSCLVESAEYDSDAKQWTVTVAGGETLTADLYISAMGTIPNNGFIPPSLLNGQGWVDVDRHLRAMNGQAVEPNVYALGDIAAHEERLLLRVPSQVSATVTNLKHDITGDGELKAYLPEEEWKAMLVPIGKSTGTGFIGSWRVWGFLVSFMKGRDFMVGKAPSLVGG